MKITLFILWNSLISAVKQLYNSGTELNCAENVVLIQFNNCDSVAEFINYVNFNSKVLLHKEIVSLFSLI